jgi:hypothetical protein
VARRWRQWYSLAADEFPFDWPIRLIVHKDLLSRIDARFASNDAVDGNKVTALIAEYWQRMLKSHEQFEMAVTERDIGQANVLAAGRAVVLFEEHDHVGELHEQPTGLWVSGSHLVEPIIWSLEKTWNSLSKADKDRSRIEAWLAGERA